MAKTTEKTRGGARGKLAEEAPSASAQPLAPVEPEGPKGVRLRLPYPRTALETFGIDGRTWQVLVDAVWPSARTPEAVMLALAYCKARNLDPLKRPIHIVPVWSKDAPSKELGKDGGYIETIWPGISEIRTTAVRTGSYAGKDAAEFGDLITETLVEVDSRTGKEKDTLEVTYPEWCRVTVFRIVQGVRCAFVGPKVFWKESYATKSRWSPLPNEMWAERRSGQLEKCAEAAALRAAFPEELGNEYSAEEMYGKRWEMQPPLPDPERQLLPGQVQPRPNPNSEFKPAASADATPQKADAAKAPEPLPADPTPAKEDPRGDPPPVEGEIVQEEQKRDILEEHPYPEDDPPGDGRAKIEALLHKATERLDACTKVGQVADLREEIEQEIPPAFEDLLKEWNGGCDAKQKMIIDARKKK